MKKLLKIREVADLLNCSISNVYAISASGELRSIRVGRGNAGLRFTEEAVEEFIAKRQQGGQSEEPPAEPPAKPPRAKAGKGKIDLW